MFHKSHIPPFIPNYPKRFYATFRENHPTDSPQRCTRIRRLFNRHNNELLLVKFETGLNTQGYLGSIDWIKEAILSPRWVGQHLFPINEWPVFVYVVARHSNQYDGVSVIEDDETSIMYWAELHRTRKDAERFLNPSEYLEWIKHRTK